MKNLTSDHTPSQGEPASETAEPTKPLPTKLRGKPRGTPFCWQGKNALRLICQQCDEVSSALATYLALTWISSDSNSDTFTAAHGYIASRAGLSVRTVQARLADLQRIGLITVESPAMKAPCVYRLLLV